MKKRFTEEQIVQILQEAESGMSAKDVCRKHNMSEQSFYRWKAKYAGLGIKRSQAPAGARARERAVKADCG